MRSFFHTLFRFWPWQIQSFPCFFLFEKGAGIPRKDFVKIWAIHIFFPSFPIITPSFPILPPSIPIHFPIYLQSFPIISFHILNSPNISPINSNQFHWKEVARRWRGESLVLARNGVERARRNKEPRHFFPILILRKWKRWTRSWCLRGRDLKGLEVRWKGMDEDVRFCPFENETVSQEQRQAKCLPLSSLL